MYLECAVTVTDLIQTSLPVTGTLDTSLSPNDVNSDLMRCSRA